MNTDSGGGSSARGLAKDRRQGSHNGYADGDIRARNTLSAENTHVQVYYPFHPLRGAILQVVRRPKRGDGAVSVMDPVGKRIKIPLWMLSPDCAAITITEKAYLSKEALLRIPGDVDRRSELMAITIPKLCR